MLVLKRITVLAPRTERAVGVEGWEEISSIAEGVPGMWCGFARVGPARTEIESCALSPRPIEGGCAECTDRSPYDISTRQFKKRSSSGIGSVCPDVLGIVE